MDLEQKLKILVNKLSTGNFDEVIFEATYLNKKHPEQEIFYIFSVADIFVKSCFNF